MEWKKVKLMLIVLFLCINVFLIYMLYNKNIKSYVDTLTAIEDVFSSNNVMLIPDLNTLEQRNKMDKLHIANVTELKGDLLITMEEAINYEHIGRKKEIVKVTVVLANFIRDFAPHDLVIKNISLGYFFNSNQLNESIVSGEAEPCWFIETNNKIHVYSAYSGELLRY